MPVASGDMLAALENLGTQAEVKQHYDQWAATYDQDMQHIHGYIAPSLIANAFGKDQVSHSCSILDVGCGTGLIGGELKKRGFLNLYGSDFSDGMIAAAEAKSAYRRLIPADFSKRTSILDGVYDIVVAVDCFGPGQCGVNTLGELIRLVPRQGQIYMMIEEEFFEKSDFSSAISGLEAHARWKINRIQSANIMKLTVRTVKLVVASRV